MAWGEKCEQSMLGVDGVFDDGGSSPVDCGCRCSAERGVESWWSSQLSLPLSVPHRDGQDALNNAAVEIPEDLSRHVKLPEPPQKIQPLLSLLHQLCGFLLSRWGPSWCAPPGIWRCSKKQICLFLPLCSLVYARTSAYESQRPAVWAASL